MHPTIQRLPGECLIVPYARLSSPEHLHASYEMILPREGVARARVDGTEYAAEPGQLLVIFPGIPHSIAPEQGVSGTLMFFSEKTLPELEGEWSGARPACPVVNLSDVDRDAEHCLKRLEEMADPRRMDEALARAYLTLLFLRLREALRREPTGGVPPDILYRAMQYMSQNMTQPLSVRATARALGVNNSYLSHVLNEKLHMSFRAYLNALRIERARRLLRVTVRPIEEIGVACGFANLRTFDRVFAEQCGCTPREYRRNAVQTDRI